MLNVVPYSANPSLVDRVLEPTSEFPMTITNIHLSASSIAMGNLSCSCKALWYSRLAKLLSLHLSECYLFVLFQFSVVGWNLDPIGDHQPFMRHKAAFGKSLEASPKLSCHASHNVGSDAPPGPARRAQ